MSTDAMPEKSLIPIRTLSAITGVNAATLRAWERRYGLIKPIRTKKGHRLYNQQHIELVQHILQQIEKGIPVSQVRETLSSSNNKSSSKPQKFWREYQIQMIDAARNFDINQLDAIYHQALSLYPIDFVTQNLILPLMQELKQLLHAANISSAEYGFIYTYMRNKLGARFHHQPQLSIGTKFVATCLPNEEDELELLAFCLTAVAYNFQPLCLGKNVSLDDLPDVIKRIYAQGIVLIGTINADNFASLIRLKQRINKPVFIGGQNTAAFYEQLKNIDVVPLSGNAKNIITQLSANLVS